MTKIISQNRIEKARATQKGSGKIALAGGCFDILHAGHIHFFKSIKKKAGFLIILLESDQTVNKLKGKGRPILSQNERAQILASVKEIDLIVKLEPFLNDEKYNHIVKIIQPDIIALTINDPIKNKKDTQAGSIGAQVLEIKEKKGASTSKIIERIKNDI